MKTAAIIGILATTLNLGGVAAENQINTPPSPAPKATAAPENGMTALRRASEAKQYLFAFIHEKDDESTRAARKAFDASLQKMTPVPQSVAINRAAATEKEIVEKFGLEQAPLPLVLAIAPNGAITGGCKAEDLTEEKLREAVASPGLQLCLKALQDRRLVLLCLQNGRTKSNEAAMKGVNQFKADPQYAEITEIVKLDPSDPKETKLLTEFKADPKAKTAATVFLAPPGILVAKIDGATTKSQLAAALKKAMEACVPGSGCCPKPQ